MVVETEPPVTDDMRARMVAVEHKLNDQKSRIVALEMRQQKQDIDNAVRDERWSTTLSRLNKIDGNLSKIVWLVISGIVVAFVAFVIGGGLRLPG